MMIDSRSSSCRRWTVFARLSSCVLSLSLCHCRVAKARPCVPQQEDQFTHTVTGTVVLGCRAEVQARDSRLLNLVTEVFSDLKLVGWSGPPADSPMVRPGQW
jgi:hypothetical protein